MILLSTDSQVRSNILMHAIRSRVFDELTH